MPSERARLREVALRPRGRRTAADIVAAAAPSYVRRPSRMRTRAEHVRQIGGMVSAMRESQVALYQLANTTMTTASAMTNFWNVQHTTTTASATTVWTTWNNHLATATNSGAYRPSGTYRTPSLTPEQEWQRKHDSLVRANRVRASRLRRKIADRTAEALLMEVLNDEQQREWLLHQQVHVADVDEVRVYRIRKGWAGNIDVLEGGVKVETWCVHPRRSVPHADNVLGQLLMIQSGHAAELRGIANVTSHRRVAVTR